MTPEDKKALCQRFVQDMAYPAYICDTKLRLIYANKHFRKLTGYLLKEITGEKPNIFLAQKGSKNTSGTSKTNSAFEATLLTKKGNKIPIQISNTPIEGGSITIIMDLTQVSGKKPVYQNLIESMHEGVWTCDQDDHIVYANPQFCKLSGYSLEELKNMTEFELWDEETGERVRLINSNERKAGISSSYEATLVTKDKKKVHILVSGSPLGDGSTMGIFSDLTKLKKQELLYRKLVENMNEAVWMGDKNERTIYANPKFCEMMGYTPEEVIGTNGYSFWDETSVKKVKEVNMKYRKKGVSSSYEANLFTKSGKKIPVLVSGSPLHDGGTIGIMTDLAQLKHTEEIEKILSSALRYTRNAIIVFDTKGIIQLWNKGAKIMFGYNKAEMSRTSIKNIFSTKDVEHILEHPRVLHNLELAAIHKNKNTLIISTTITPLAPEKGGKVNAYMLIAQDVTYQMKFEEELTLKYQKLREAYNQFGIIRRQMDYVFELIKLEGTKENEKIIMDFIVNSVIMLTRADACILRKYNKKKDVLEMTAASGISADWWGSASIKYADSLAEKAVKSGYPLKIIDITQETKYGSKLLAKKNGLSSLLLIPLFSKGEFIGSLTLFVKADKKLEIFENEFIEQYAKLVELTLRNVFGN